MGHEYYRRVEYSVVDGHLIGLEELLEALFLLEAAGILKLDMPKIFETIRRFEVAPLIKKEKRKKKEAA